MNIACLHTRSARRLARTARCLARTARSPVCLASALMVGASLAACADFSGAIDPTFGLPDAVVESPTLATDVQPMLDKRCAFGGCHSAATHQSGLTLTAESAYDALVGKRSTLRPSQTLVVAGDTTRSWLLVMLSADEARRSGVSRMPLAASPLTPNQLATVARWIARGAPRQ